MKFDIDTETDIEVIRDCYKALAESAGEYVKFFNKIRQLIDDGV